jgi:hypothetical protein
LDGQVPKTLVTASTADISEITEFKWYQWVYFRDTTVEYPDDKEVLGHYLGPATEIGPAMAAKILKCNGQTVVHTTFRPLTDDEILKDDIKQKRISFDAQIEQTLGTGFKPDNCKGNPDVETPLMPPYGDDQGNELQMPDTDEFDVDAYDQYGRANANLPQGDSMANARVLGQKREQDGSLKCKANANPMREMHTYNVLFPEGLEIEYTANMIDKIMWAQADLYGNQYLLLDPSQITGAKQYQSIDPS